jgi:NAD(P)-dependent dehydrogenase (short-subunit alcohol dehydrogenase family)
MKGEVARPLEGRVAIVTGASRGIGRAIAQRLGAAGATVVVAARARGPLSATEAARDTCEAIEACGGHAVAAPLELSDPASRAALIEDAIDRFGCVDILVNNAGTATYKLTEELSLDEAVGMIDAYLLGPWDLCHHVLPHMKTLDRAWIVNVGSVAAFEPEPPLDAVFAQRGPDTLYATLKAAMHRFTVGLAAELSGFNISVNLVAPVTGVWTPGLAGLGRAGLTAESPILEPVEHIAEAALDMLCREPRDHTGRIAMSHEYLAEIGRPTMTLDGREILRAVP